MSWIKTFGTAVAIVLIIAVLAILIPMGFFWSLGELFGYYIGLNAITIIAFWILAITCPISGRSAIVNNTKKVT